MRYWFNVFTAFILLLVGGVAGKQHNGLVDQWHKTKAAKRPLPASLSTERFTLKQDVIHRVHRIPSFKPRSPQPNTVLQKENIRLLREKFRGKLAQAKATASWTIQWNERQGVPRFINGLQDDTPLRTLGAAASAERIARQFFKQYADVFQLKNPEEELYTVATIRDALQKEHVVFQQSIHGIPVWGKDIVVHLNTDGSIYAFNGYYLPTLNREYATIARVDAATAVAIATQHLSREVPIQTFSQQVQQLLDYSQPRATQYFWEDTQSGEVHLVWHVEIRPNLRDDYYYFIDAQTGEILERYNNTRFDGPATAQATDLNGQTRTIHVYLYQGTYYMLDASRPTWQEDASDPINKSTGGLVTLDARNQDLTSNTTIYYVTSSNNQWNDATSVSAHYNVGKVFEYYYNTHNRRGIDGEGGTIYSIIHVTDQGQSMENAYWNGKVMAYGDGGQMFKPLAGALDVAAHEMTHGVIERTVNLEYKFQSGALNESLADIFGAMVDRDDWQMGEDVVKGNAFPSGALRDLADPHNGGTSLNDPGWQPANMNEYVDLTIDQDNGGVHINSGIPNHAAYLIATQIGREKTERIYYRVMDVRYLNSQSNFVDMRNACVQAARDLYGENSAEVQAVNTAFDQVGITGEGSTPDPELPPVQGDQWFITIGTADYLPYLVKHDVSEIYPLTQTQVYPYSSNPVTITDDGSTIFFVDIDNYIRVIGSDGSNEQIISSDGVWSAISISPNGQFLAANTIYQDSVLYVFDLTGQNPDMVFKLYQPTTQEGVYDYVTLYSDAMDWDFSNQYIIFDAFNSIPQQSGDSLEFWNINVLDIATGQIFPVFPPQPEGISMGNPSFAQTDDNIFTFDYVDFNANEDVIMAANLFTGEVKTVFNNGDIIGYPNYTTQDDRIVFQTWVTDNFGNTDYGVAYQPLSNDKITPSGQAQALVSGGIRPKWFAIGSRPTAIEDPAPDVTKAFYLGKNYPNPFNPSTTIPFTVSTRSEVEITVYDNTGRRIKTLAKGEYAPGNYTVQWNGKTAAGRPVASGVYFYRMTVRVKGQQVYSRYRKLLLMK